MNFKRTYLYLEEEWLIDYEMMITYNSKFRGTNRRQSRLNKVIRKRRQGVSTADLKEALRHFRRGRKP